MSEQKHTPEPWEVFALKDRIQISEKKNPKRHIANKRFRLKQAEKDFERIVACVNALEGFADPSAAKDLLEALEEMTTFLDDFYEGTETLPEITKARAAIAKAKGEANE